MRLDAFDKDAFTKVSIHASVKDATKFSFFNSSVLLVSIHASVKDATSGPNRYLDSLLFQSTHL